MRTDNAYVKNRIEWLLTEIGIPATRLAALVGISPSALEKWRHNKLILTTARVRQVAQRLQELELYGRGEL